MASTKTVVFADTSFLIAGGSLNREARAELFAWLDKLDDRFKVPAWVAHELYGKINSETNALTPMQTFANDAANALKLVQSEARRFVDQGRIMGFQEDKDKAQLIKDRVGFLANLDHEVGVLMRRIKHLSHVGAQSLDEAVDALVNLVSPRVLNSDIYTGLHELEALHATRLVGKHPPGFADRKKDDNRYGDLIIWREIVEAVRSLPEADETKTVVLLTNDNKKDWVYTPQGLLPEKGQKNGRQNDTVEGFRVFFPLPLLVHEMRQARAGCDFHIVNMAMIANLLHNATGAAFAHLYASYQDVSASDDGTAGKKDGHDAETPLLPADIVSQLGERSPERAATIVPAARAYLADAPAGEEMVAVIKAVMEGSDRNVEPASLLVRDLLASRAGKHRTAVLTSMFDALYFDSSNQC